MPFSPTNTLLPLLKELPTTPNKNTTRGSGPIDNHNISSAISGITHLQLSDIPITPTRNPVSKLTELHGCEAQSEEAQRAAAKRANKEYYKQEKAREHEASKHDLDEVEIGGLEIDSALAELEDLRLDSHLFSSPQKVRAEGRMIWKDVNESQWRETMKMKKGKGDEGKKAQEQEQKVREMKMEAEEAGKRRKKGGAGGRKKTLGEKKKEWRGRGRGRGVCRLDELGGDGVDGMTLDYDDVGADERRDGNGNGNMVTGEVEGMDKQLVGKMKDMRLLCAGELQSEQAQQGGNGDGDAATGMQF